MGNNYFGEYTTLVDEAGKFHGGICRGIATGTRMTMSGLRRIDISDPKGADRKKLMVFVEIDRCATDAIMALTGCRPGKRTMKILDYGKMAATFINLESGKSVRVVTRSNRKITDGDPVGMPYHNEALEKEMFLICDVEVQLLPEDMPGKPLRNVICTSCGETVLDGREIKHQGESLCKPCFAQSDYCHVVA
jgi:formylmethanofuran dehydrogenase subunit E